MPGAVVPEDVSSWLLKVLPNSKIISCMEEGTRWNFNRILKFSPSSGKTLGGVMNNLNSVTNPKIDIEPYQVREIMNNIISYFGIFEPIGVDYLIKDLSPFGVMACNQITAGKMQGKFEFDYSKVAPSINSFRESLQFYMDELGPSTYFFRSMSALTPHNVEYVHRVYQFYQERKEKNPNLVMLKRGTDEQLFEEFKSIIRERFKDVIKEEGVDNAG
jgi:hypothetical protein